MIEANCKKTDADSSPYSSTKPQRRKFCVLQDLAFDQFCNLQTIDNLLIYMQKGGLIKKNVQQMLELFKNLCYSDMRLVKIATGYYIVVIQSRIKCKEEQKKYGINELRELKTRFDKIIKQKKPKQKRSTRQNQSKAGKKEKASFLRAPFTALLNLFDPALKEPKQCQGQNGYNQIMSEEKEEEVYSTNKFIDENDA